MKRKLINLENTVHFDDAVLSDAEGTRMEIEVAAFTFLCKECDDTHLIIYCLELDLQPSLRVKPNQMDALLKHLTNPPPQD